MQNRFKTKLKVFKGRPDLTPMIDVVFLLLIFFMLSSSFVQVSGIPVVLPESGAKNEMSIDKLVVTIDRNNKLFFNDVPMEWETLTIQLQKCKQQLNADTVIVRADKSTEYGMVVKLMSLARALNLNVYIATMTLEQKKEKDFRDVNSD